MDLTLTLKIGRQRKPRVPAADRNARSAITLAGVTLSSASTLALSAAASIALSDFTVAAIGADTGTPPAEGTIDLAWDGNAENLIPIFETFDIPDPRIGDVIEMRRAASNLFTSYDSASATITSLNPVNVLDFNFGGNWPLATRFVQVRQTRSSVLIDTSNIETVTITGDITGPVLSNPVDTAVTGTTGSGSVDTNEADGTLYWVVSSSATAPSAAQVKAGQTHTGAAATDSGSQAVTATGTQSISGGFTMTAGATFYAHYMHEDGDGNQSSVVSGDGRNGLGCACGDGGCLPPVRPVRGAQAGGARRGRPQC